MAMRKSVTGIAIVFFAVARQAQAQTPAQAPAKPQAAAPAAKKPAAESYDRALLHPAQLKEKAPETFQVKFETTRGDFTMDVTRAWAPIGVDRFYNLVKHHFFDNMVAYRVHAGFVVQFGISSYPAVSAAWRSSDINDVPVTQSNIR